MVDALPEETQLGIRTLGADYPGNDKKVGCQDTQQIYPVGPVDRAAGQGGGGDAAPHRLDPDRPRAARRRQGPGHRRRPPAGSC